MQDEVGQPANGITGIDHPVVAARNLAAARKAFENLGFTVPPRGSHVEWGTGNLCIMFPEDYLEIRGIIDPERFTMHLDSHLERFGEGLMGVAFGTRDVEQSHTTASAAGIECGELRQLTRNFEHPEGWTQPAFRLFAPSARDINGLMHVVVIEHLTPTLIRRDDFLTHANGCLGVTAVAGIVEDVDSSAQAMRRLLGEKSTTIDSDGVHVSLPRSQHIDLLTPEAYAKSFGPPPGNGPRLWTMTLRVADLGRLQSLLEENAVACTTPGPGTIRVGPEFCCGTSIEFTDRLSE